MSRFCFSILLILTFGLSGSASALRQIGPEEGSSKELLMAGMEERFHIRWMIRRDMPEVLQIEKEVSSQAGVLAWNETDFLKVLRGRNMVGLVVESRGNVVGFLMYVLFENHLEIFNIGFREESVGVALIEKLKGKLSPHRRFEIVVLTAVPERKSFYETHGFKMTQFLKGFYETEPPRDAYQMVYRLPGAEPPAPAISKNPTFLRGTEAIFEGSMSEAQPILKKLFENGEVQQLFLNGQEINIFLEATDTIIELGIGLKQQPARFERKGNQLQVTTLETEPKKAQHAVLAELLPRIEPTPVLPTASAAVSAVSEASPVVSVAPEERAKATERVDLAFMEISKKIDQAAFAGIGPSESARHADALRLVSLLMPESLRKQVFVVASTPAQEDLLRARGIVAGYDPKRIARYLKELFGSQQKVIHYVSTPAEQLVLQDLVTSFGTEIEIQRKDGSLDLETLLQQLIAVLAGPAFEEISKSVNFKQLTEDVSLLIRA